MVEQRITNRPAPDAAVRPKLVSVIIPAYDAALYIADALDSVFRQTYRDFEIILVNDGSPDTEQFERAIEPFRKRLVYIRQENRGPAAASNTAVLRARGEYLAFLDSDDAWYPDCLEAQIGLLTSTDPPYDLVYSDILHYSRTVQDGVRYMQKFPSNGPVTFASLLEEQCSAPTSCTVVRRAAVMAAGLFDERFVRAEDYVLWLRVARGGARMAFQKKVLGRHRVRPESLGSDQHQMLLAVGEVLEKLDRELELSPPERSLLRKKLKDSQAQVQLHRGKAQLLAGNFGEAKDSFSRVDAAVSSTKLRWTLFGLTFAPRLMQVLARMWLTGGE